MKVPWWVVETVDRLPVVWGGGEVMMMGIFLPPSVLSQASSLRGWQAFAYQAKPAWCRWCPWEVNTLLQQQDMPVRHHHTTMTPAGPRDCDSDREQYCGPPSCQLWTNWTNNMNPRLLKRYLKELDAGVSAESLSTYYICEIKKSHF